MFMEIIKEIEIVLAFEGENGLSWIDFWSQLEKLLEKTTEKVALYALKWDTAYKSYIWDFLKKNKNLLFSSNDNLLDVEPITFEQADNVIKRVKISEELQDRMLFGVLKPEDCNISDKHRLVLRHVGKRKYEGITQLKLTEELGLDARATFYYLKKLTELNLITRKSIYTPGKATYIIYFHQFVPDDKIEDKKQDKVDSSSTFRLDLVDNKILDLLRDAKDNIMALDDIISKLGFQNTQEIKWIQARIIRFHQQGVLEKVIANDGTSAKTCVRLPLPGQIADKADEYSKASPIFQTAQIYRDLPIEYQIYQYVSETNEKGVAKQDMLKRFPHLKWAFINSFLDKMCDIVNPASNQHMIYRIEELERKVRQFRYFSREAFLKLKQNMDHNTPELTENSNEKNKRKREENILEIERSASEEESSIVAESPKKQTKNEKATEIEDELKVNRKRALHIDLPLPASSEPVKKKPSSKKTTKMNTTKFRRHQILLDMIEKHRVHEINNDLFIEFNRIEEAAVGQKMARQTFRRMTNDLSDEGKLKIVRTDVHIKFGMTEYKSFLLHPSLDENSKPFTDLLQSYKSGWNTPVTCKPKELREISVDKIPGKDTRDQDSRYQANLKYSTWRPVAIENGWISSKWLRVREIHNYLFTRFLQMLDQNPSLALLESSDFATLMPLDLLIKIFSSLPLDTELQEFIKSDVNRALTLSELPEYIQTILSRVYSQIRNTILTLIDALEALELMKRIQTNTGFLFEVNQEGRIYNYATSPPTLLEVVSLQNKKDISIFWSKLENYYTKAYHDIVGDNTPPFPFIKPHPLYNIAVGRSWYVETSYSEDQKVTLNSFVDYGTESTPFSNKPLLIHLSKQLHIPVDRVKSYYMSLETAFKKKQNQIRKMEEKRIMEEKKKKRSQDSGVIQSLLAASINKKKISTSNENIREVSPFVEPTFVGSKRFRKLKVKSFNKNDTENDMNSNEARFSPVEKDALLFCYSIMRVRAKTSVFYWSPIKQVLNGRNPEKCRRVMFHMMRYIPSIPVKLQQLQEQWECIYKKGIQNGEITDENPWDTMNYDLKGYLEYFIVNMQHNIRQRQDMQSVILPKNYQILKSRFQVSQYIPTLLKCRVKEEKCAVIQRYEQSIYDVPSVINRDGTQHILADTAAVVIKMLMMIPPDIYNPEEAYNIMKRYPEDVIVKATNSLQEEGVVIKAKVKKGRIPGRMLRISDRFITLASGVVPSGFFDEAKSYFLKMVNEKSINLTNINGSEMASLLDLLSQDKIELDIKNRQKYIRIRRSLVYPKLSAVELCKTYISSGLDVVVKSKEISKYEQKNEMKTVLEPIGDITTQIQPLEAQEPDIKKVYHVIQSFGTIGASIDEIEAKSKTEGHKNVMKCCTLLASNIPPLIKLVGSRRMRYVAFEFIQEHVMKTNDDTNLMEPWMWCDTSGNILLPVLKGCCQVVLGHILERPGISQAQLKKVLDCFFTAYELHSILKYLETKGTIRCVKIRVPSQKTTLFGKHSVPSLQKTKVKCGNEISHYWLASDYYAKI